MLAFEEAFEIDIPDEDTEKIRTVQDAVDYIERHAKKYACSSSDAVLVSGTKPSPRVSTAADGVLFCFQRHGSPPP